MPEKQGSTERSGEGHAAGVRAKPRAERVNPVETPF